MPELVVDASIAGGWFIRDETSEYADATLRMVTDHGAHVPSLWLCEVANLLAVAERRERATADVVTAALRYLAALDVVVDVPRGLAGSPALTYLAREHGLTAYDAAYLELAMRTRSMLATRDGDLRRAAQRAGVPLFSP